MIESTQLTQAVYSQRDVLIRETAQELEASFLSVMLKSAGLGEAKSAFGGGEGEAQFTSFLRDTQARQMVKAGGVGLAELFFEAIKRMDDGTYPS